MAKGRRRPWRGGLDYRYEIENLDSQVCPDDYRNQQY